MKKITSDLHPIPHKLLETYPTLNRLRTPGRIHLILALVLVSTGLWLLALPVIVPLILLSLLRSSWEYFLPGLCTEVWMDDDRLMCKRNGLEICVPLAQIESIRFRKRNNPPYATIQLRKASPFGPTLSFVPDVSRGRFCAQLIVDELRRRCGIESTGGMDPMAMSVHS